MLKGVVLAGGKSERFGEDKAMAVLGAGRLIERPVRLLESIGIEPIVIANASRDYSFLNCRIENDRIAHQGPLGGIDAAFGAFPDADLLVLTCDMPNLTAESLEVLVRAWRGDSQAVIFRSARPELQPFPGIYGASLKNGVTDSLRRGDVSMQAFLKTIPEKALVSLPRPPESVFLNINAREDLGL